MSYYTGGDYVMPGGSYYRGGGFFGKLKKGLKKVAHAATHTTLGKLALGAVVGGGIASAAIALAGHSSPHTGQPGESLPMPGTRHHYLAREARQSTMRRPYARRRSYRRRRY